MFRAPNVPAEPESCCVHSEVLKNRFPPRIFYCRRGRVEFKRLVEKVPGFVRVCKPSTLSRRSLLTFIQLRCCVQVLSVTLHPVRVNMNSPPSVCLPYHLSVFSDFPLSPSSPSTSCCFPYIVHSLSSPLTSSIFLLLSSLPADRQVGVLHPIRGLDFDHMPVEDRPKPAALLMQGKP